MRKLQWVLALLIFVLALGAFHASVASAGGSFCLYCTLGCNDLKIVYTETAAPEYFSLTGYEYGCSKPERSLVGSARISGSTIYVQLYSDDPFATEPGITLVSIQLAASTLSGPAQWSVWRSAYTHGTDSYLLVTCPAPGKPADEGSAAPSRPDRYAPAK